MVTHELDDEHKKIVSRCCRCKKYPLWGVWVVGGLNREFTLLCDQCALGVSFSIHQGTVIKEWNKYINNLKGEKNGTTRKV